MTRRLVLGFVLAGAVALAGPWPFGKKDKTAKTEKAEKKEKLPGFDSQYTGGSVALIPQYTNGKLDLSDRNKLQFHYGKPTLAIPYAKITSIEVADKRMNEWIQVPKLSKRKRVFTIQFENDRGATQKLNLEMNLTASMEALPLLQERSGKDVQVLGVADSEGYWGDRYWKTAANAEMWDAANKSQKTSASIKH